MGDRLDQFELTGSGRDEASHPPVAIDNSLKIRDKLGDSLDFIEHRRFCRTVRDGRKSTGMANCIAWYNMGQHLGFSIECVLN